MPADTPLVFTAEFFDDADKQKQWAAFVNKHHNYIPETSLEQVCGEISVFLTPVVDGLAGNRKMPTDWHRGTWVEK